MGEYANPGGYNLWMGRWSARLAPAFVRFAALPKGGRVLDVGSGTGVLASALLEGVEDGTVVAIEPAESYVAFSRERLRDPRLRIEQGDALAIAFEDDSFDSTLSLLILKELPDAPKAMQEMRRVTRAGGRVAASQWNFADGLPMFAWFWEAVVEIIATDAARQAAADCMVADYPDEDALKRLWEGAGLTDVETGSLKIAMDFAGFEDYWTPFLTGVTPTTAYAGGLGEEERQALKDGLRKKIIGGGPDRPFSLPAQAWAVRGTVPRS